jgi:hypothetical protein
VNPLENHALTGSVSIEIAARVAGQIGEADRAIAALHKLLSIPYAGALAPNVPLTPALLRLDPMFDPLRTIRTFKNSSLLPRHNRLTNNFDAVSTCKLLAKLKPQIVLLGQSRALS